jgi:hypothetical protein
MPSCYVRLRRDRAVRGLRGRAWHEHLERARLDPHLETGHGRLRLAVAMVRRWGESTAPPPYCRPFTIAITSARPRTWSSAGGRRSSGT